MDFVMLFIIASLIFGLAVIVVANIWVLRAPETEVQRSVSHAIDEILEADNGMRELDRSSLHDRDHPS
jgi:hypothetical protein